MAIEICTRNCARDLSAHPCPKCGHSGFFHTMTGTKKTGKPCDVCAVLAAQERMDTQVEEMRVALEAWSTLFGK